jgi:RHS repeat-associated protein
MATIAGGVVAGMLAATGLVAGATTTPPAPNGTCGLCVLAPSGQSLKITGSGTSTMSRANVIVNSSGKPAVTDTGSGSLKANSVGVVGTVSQTGTGTIQNVTTGISPVADPLASLAVPSLTRPSTVPSATLTGASAMTISPGVYQDITLTGSGALTLNPGTYVVLHSFAITGSGSLTASGVTLYLACSSYPTPCTSSGQAGASLALTGSGRFTLTGPTASCAPVAIFSDRYNTSALSITGSSTQTLSGAIYAKSGALTITGSSGTTAIGGPIVVGNVTLTGSGALSLTGALPFTDGLSLSLAGAPSAPSVGSTETLTATLGCGGQVFSGQTVTFAVTGANPATGTAVTNASGVATFTYTGHATGTDTATASFTGNSSNVSSSPVTVTWGKAHPGLSTAPSASVALGGSIRDTATLTGGSSPAGSITFNIYRSSDSLCATPVNTSPLVATLSGGTAQSPAFTPTSAGTYQFVASYAGDANNAAVAGMCGDVTEQVVVTKGQPSIATHASASVGLGGSITDTATLTGGSSPTGTVTFNVYRSTDTTCATPVNTSPLTASVSAGSAQSPAFTPAAAGTYTFIASFGGDANNNTVAGHCGDANESVVVGKAQPTISTHASASVAAGGSISDTATLAGGTAPTGTVTFNVYRSTDTTCATPVNTSPLTASVSSAVAQSPAFTPTAAGTYTFVASYGGDANNSTVAGHCGDANESVVVTKAQPSISTQASASVAVGGSIRDTATLAGSSSPTGTVTFNVYAAADTTCATPLNTSPLTATLSGASAQSPTFTPAAAGTYRFVASYGGDANNNTVAGHCGDANESVVVTKAQPTISTQASASVTLGGSIRDTATLAGGGSPTGTVTFNVYAASDTTCAAPLNASPLTATLTGASAQSPTFTPTAAGTFTFVASYGGDANNSTVAGHCGDANESVVVTKAQPSISTQASASVAVGGAIRDTATLAGGSSPSGTVSFNVYRSTDTTCVTPVNGSPLTATVSAGSAQSPAFTPPAAGTYTFVTSYGGDANNNAVSGHCGDANESVVVTKAQPTLSTQASASVAVGGSIRDTATLAGGSSPTGTVTFNVYRSTDTTCATPVNGSPLTATLSGASAPSPAFTPTAAGTYTFVASYGGDANNNPVAGHCGDANESVVVTKAQPSITTAASGSVALGATIRDTAVVNGGSSPAGTVTFNVYAAADTTCATPLNSSPLTATLSGGSALSPAFTPTAAGTYTFVAAYAGDANNQSANGHCGDANESVVVTKAQPTIVTSASPSVTVGGAISDTATVSGGSSPTGTVTFNAYAASDTTCTTPVNSSPLSATLTGGTAHSSTFTPATAGTYHFVASYGGDANNLSATGHCGDNGEDVTVNKAQPTILTQASPEVTVGAAISDTATVSGGSSPTGTVSFNVYAASDTTCATPVNTAPLTATLNSGVAQSPPFTPVNPGTYVFVATYNGDVSNLTATGTCGASAEQVIVDAAHTNPCTITFTGPDHGLWQTAANWTPNRTPTATDVACVAAGITVELTGDDNHAGILLDDGGLDITGGSLTLGGLAAPPGFAGNQSSVANLSVGGGTLTLLSELDVSTSFLAGGTETISGSGELNIGPNVAGRVNSEDCGRLTLDGVTFVNQGSIDDGIAGRSFASSAIWMQSGARLDNRGTFNVSSLEECSQPLFAAILLNDTGGPQPSIVNSGTFTGTFGFNTGHVSVPFTNTGTVEALAGTLAFDDGGSSTGGSLSAASGAKLSFGGGSFALSGDTLAGPGALSVDGATVTATHAHGDTASVSVTAGSLTIPSGSTTAVTGLSLTGGTLALPGELDVSASLTADGTATIGGPGSLVVGAGASGRINGSDCDRLTLDGVTLVNNGTIDDGEVGRLGTSPLLMQGGAQLHNAGTFNLDSLDQCNSSSPSFLTGISRSDSTGPAPSITNSGTFTSSVSFHTVGVGVAIANSGTIRSEVGALALTAGGSGSGGTWTADSGAKVSLAGGSFALSGDTLSGAFGVDGAAASATHVTADASDLNVSSGSLTIPAGSTTTVHGLTLTGGTLSLAGELDVSNSFITGGGRPGATIAGAGRLVVDGSATGIVNGGNCDLLTLDGVTFVNNGSIDDGPADESVGTGAIRMRNGARFDNAGTFELRSVDQCDGGTTPALPAIVTDTTGGGAAPSIMNTGTFTSELEFRTGEVSVPFTNDGSVHANEGAVQFTAGGIPGDIATGCWFATGGTAVLVAGAFDVEDDGTFQVQITGATVNHHPSGLSGALNAPPATATGTITITGHGADSNIQTFFNSATVEASRAGRDQWFRICGPLTPAADGSFSCQVDTASGSFRDGDYDLRARISDCDQCVKTITTAVVHVRIANDPLTLTPRKAGPDPVGTTQTLTASVVNPDGSPAPGQSVQLDITGANPQTLTAVTDDDGDATFTYTGDHEGQDTAQASLDAPGGSSTLSNTATITWSRVLADVSSTPVQGDFYAADTSQNRFTAKPGDTPAFSQTFPTIDFNPPAGSKPNPWFVDDKTRPFTDLTTDQVGKVNGELIAHGNGLQAGTGDLRTFEAAFTANFVVARAGDVTFKLTSEDGFLLGIGGDAQRVNGVYDNAPASNASAFGGLPLVAASNQACCSTPQAYTITVHFPAAGSYPYELDHFQHGGTPLSLVMTTASFAADTSPLSVYVGYADGRRPPSGDNVFPFPWQGSAAVTNFIGSGGEGGDFDSGALRFDNSSDDPITLNDVSVDLGATHSDLWGNDITVGPHQITILTQLTDDDDFDTSDFAPGPCDAPSSIIPQIHVTTAGATTTYADTQQVLNTKGIDPPLCGNPSANEAQPWSRIGGGGTPVNVPMPSAVYLSITPTTVTGNQVGQEQKLTVTARNEAGDPVDGLSVDLRVSGANSQDLPVVTDSDGIADTTYTGTRAGKDVVSASAFISGLHAASNQLIVPWAIPLPPAAVLPDPPPASTGGDPPDVDNMAPHPGAVVTGSTPVTATITSTSALTSWKATLTPAGGDEIVLGQNSGTPPDVLGTIDPSKLGGGTYLLAVTASTAGGSASESGDITVGPVPGVAPPAPVFSDSGAPTITDISPGNGSVVGVPSALTAHATAPAGQHITEWVATLQPADGSGSPVTLADTTVEQPAPLATIDPSQFTDGTYTLKVTAHASGGGFATSWETLTLGLGMAQPTQVAGDGTGGGDTGAGGTGGGGTGGGAGPVGSGGGGGGGTTVEFFGPPTIGDITPATGTLVTEPQPIKATITADDNDSIATWTVVEQGSHDTTATTIGSGTGAPPDTLATFDPTKLANDTYTVTVQAMTTGGASASRSVSLVVMGKLKLGRFTQTYNDLTVPVVGFPMTVGRMYDSTDKGVGDFGVGWHQTLSGFTVTTNGALGNGGWSQFPANCVFTACGYAYRSRPAHTVTVTWPDKHQEEFDFAPTGDTFDNVEVKPGFKPHAGTDTTSTLKVDGDADIIYGFDGDLNDGNDDAPWTATRFDLTTADGYVFVLDTQVGLVSVTDRNGNTMTVTHDGIESSAGPGLQYIRDDQGRITDITGPTGQHLHYEYDDAGDLVLYRDANGNETTYTYNDNHDLLHVEGAGTPNQQQIYDPDTGRLKEIIDAVGNVTHVDVDVGARTETVDDPNGKLTTVNSYDTLGDLTQQDQVFDGRTLTTTHTYDPLGRMLSTTDPLNHTISATYNAANEPLTETTANGNTTTYKYDAQNLLQTVIGPDGSRQQEIRRDSAGNVLTETAANNTTKNFTYNTAGQETSATNASNRKTQFAYDSIGNIESVTDPTGAATQITANASGQTVSETGPLNDTTSASYDGDGNLRDVVDPRGHLEQFTYNAFGETLTSTDQLGNPSVATYDPVGRISTFKDRNNAQSTFFYDADGNQTRSVVDGVESTTRYDALERPTEMANPTQTLDFQYDDGSRLGSTSSSAVGAAPASTLSYGYDPDGNTTSLAGVDGTTTSTYDRFDRLETLHPSTEPNNATFKSTYDTSGRATAVSRPDGIDSAFTYQGGDVASVVAYDGATPIVGSTYTYDDAGLRASSGLIDGDATAYHYDDAHQLTDASNATTEAAFSYDPAGNRLPGIYNADDELVSDGTATYEYDADGQLVQRTNTASHDVTRFDWDGQHQLTAIHLPNGDTETFLYDPLGRRVSSDDGSGATSYVYDGASAHLEYDSGNAGPAAVYTNGPGVDDVLEMARDGHRYSYLDDEQGSVLALADENGHVAERYTYDAFGTQTASGDVTNPFTYTGREYDEASGLYYFRARWYDPIAGRFISRDPLPSVNPYVYTLNDPTNAVDPSGEQGALVGVGVALGVTLLAADLTVIAVPPATAFIQWFAQGVNNAINEVWNAIDGDPALPKPPTGPGAVPKSDRDPQRLFPRSTVQGKLNDQNGLCAGECGNPIDELNDAIGHHVERHADGGQTDDDNLAVVCKDCHKDLHGK